MKTPWFQRALLWCVLGLYAVAATARAGPGDQFKPGTYECRNAAGSVKWSLTFTPDPKSAKRFFVTGTWGATVLRMTVTGAYDAQAKRLSAQTAKTSVQEMGVDAGFGLVNIEGWWKDDTGTLLVLPAGYKTGDHLSFVSALPPPTPPTVAILALTPEPLVGGTPVRGKARLKFENIRQRTSGKAVLTFRDSLQNLTVVGRQVITTDANGESDLDLLRMGVTIPEAASSCELTLYVTVDPMMVDGDKRVVRFDSIDHVQKPVYVSQFNGSLEDNSDNEDHPVAFKALYSLTGSDQGGAGAAYLATTVRTSCTVQPDGGDTIRVDSDSYQVDIKEGEVTNIKPVRIALPTDLHSGGHTITYRVEGERVRPFVWSRHFFTTGDGSQSPPPNPPDPADVVSYFVFSKTVLKKPNDTLTVDLKYGYSKGPDTVDIDVVVEVIKPDGSQHKLIKKRNTVKKMDQGYHPFRAVCTPNSTPGEYKIKVTLSGNGVRTYTETKTFTIEDPAGGSTPPTTPTPTTKDKDPLGSNDQSGQGVYGLVKKEVGKAAPAQGDPYGEWSGSQGENSFTANYQMKAPYQGTFSANMTWSPPPAVLKPGETIELTCTASATASGKDLGSPGGSACWVAEGSVETIEKVCAFAGVSGSSGKLIGSGQGKTRIQIGRGGTITLYSSHPGFSWGSGGVWSPCVYTYQFNSKPTVQPAEDKPKPNPDEPPKPPTEDDPNDKGLLFGSADPKDDELPQQIVARLDTDSITLRAGEMSETVHVIISNFRGNTMDRVEVIFPQIKDWWGSLPGQIVAGGGNASYDPSNMNRPEHSDGWFMSARRTAPSGSYTVDIVVRQKNAGSVQLKLAVKVIAARKLPPADPPPTNQPGGPVAATPDPGPPVDFNGPWNTTYGPITLTQRGLHVEGTFATGVITGTVQGDSLTFKIDEHEFIPAIGYGRFRMDPDNQGFQGGWTYSDRIEPPMSTWNGRRGGPGAGALPPGVAPPGPKFGKPEVEPGVPGGFRPVPSGNEPPSTTPPSTNPGPGVPVHTPPGGPGFIPPGNNGGNPPPAGGKGGGGGNNTPPGITPSDTAHGRPGTIGAGGPLTPTGGQLDPNAWSSEGQKGARASVNGDRVVVEVPKSSDGEAHSFAKTTLKGDFDLTVDYALLDWKPGADSMLQWSIYFCDKPDVAAKNQLTVAHIAQDNSSDIVVARTNSDKTKDKPAAGKTDGKIRIARAGNTWTVSQWAGGKWEVVDSVDLPLPGEVHFGLGLERNGPVGAKASLRPHPTE